MQPRIYMESTKHNLIYADHCRPGYLQWEMVLLTQQSKTHAFSSSFSFFSHFLIVGRWNEQMSNEVRDGVCERDWHHFVVSCKQQQQQ